MTISLGLNAVLAGGISAGFANGAARTGGMPGLNLLIGTRSALEGTRGRAIDVQPPSIPAATKSAACIEFISDIRIY